MIFFQFFSSDDEKTKDDYVQKLSTSISESIKDYCKKELQSFKSKVRKSAGKNAQHAEQFITLIDQGRASIYHLTGNSAMTAPRVAMSFMGCMSCCVSFTKVRNTIVRIGKATSIALMFDFLKLNWSHDRVFRIGDHVTKVSYLGVLGYFIIIPIYQISMPSLAPFSH